MVQIRPLVQLQENEFCKFQLPSKRELPDYYEVITKPMDFNRIQKKLQSERLGLRIC